MKALKRGKFELEGEEILAFSQCFAWLGSLSDRMKASLEIAPLASASPTEPASKKGKK